MVIATAPVAEKQKEKSRFASASSSLAVAAILFFIGVAAVAYPVVSTLHNNAAASRVADEMSAEIEALDDDYKDDLLAEMRAYNDSLRSNPVVPGIPEKQDLQPTGEYERYLDVGRPHLLSTDTMSQIIIPDIGVRLPVYRGSGPMSLNRGAGHLFGTTLPVGGPGTNTAITAHTGMATATMFDNLINLKKGQDIFVTTLGETMRYRMVDSVVVPPDTLDAIPPVGASDEDRLFLITCTPYGLNFNRLIVEAHRIPLDAEPYPGDITDVTNSVGPWQTWMTVVAVIFAVFISAMTWVLASAARRRKSSSTPDSTISNKG